MSNILSKLAHGYSVGVRSIRPKTVRVKMTASDMVDAYARALHRNYTRYTPGGTSVEIPEVMEFVQACRMIIKARIIYVSGGRLPERPQSRAWVIPHGLYAIIELIGKVYVKEHDLHVEPDFNPDVDVISDEAWKGYRKVALFMQSMESLMPVAYTIPRGDAGNEEFMLFQHVDAVIKSPLPNAEPGTALASAFIRAETFNAVLNAVHDYSTAESYQYAVEELAAPSAGAGQ